MLCTLASNLSGFAPAVDEPPLEPQQLEQWRDRIEQADGLASLLADQDSERACEELFHRYQQKVYLWCFNYTRNVEDALDWTQEIFIKIFRNVGRFAGRSRFSTWVTRINASGGSKTAWVSSYRGRLRSVML